MIAEVTEQELGILVVLRRAAKPLQRKAISLELGYKLDENNNAKGSNIQRGLKRLCELGLVERQGDTRPLLRFSLAGNKFPVVKLRTHRNGRIQKQKLAVEHLFPQALSGQL